MLILVINAGSSSLKYQLIDSATEAVVAKGNAERVGIAGSKLSQKNGDQAYEIEISMPDHIAAMEQVFAALIGQGVIADASAIGAVGHRVVHGGENFSASVIINDDVLAAIRQNVPLAPLHNPANLMGIEACQKLMPNVPQVAVVDTAFHQTMPEKAFLYGVPYEWYTRLKVRRYGFHGTSHRFVAERAAQMLGKPLESLKLVTCHLGNGSSIAAVDGGKSVDTSMGLTPLEGVSMGTRSGDIDPAIIKYVMDNDSLSIAEVDTCLNKKSGLFGVSGISSDMRDIIAGCKENNPRAIAALEGFAYRVLKYVGSYAAAMGGLDAVIFTAGIGENTPEVRSIVAKGLGFLGAKLDEQKNQGRTECDLSTPDSRVKILLVNTNEELAIARDTQALVAGN